MNTFKLIKSSFVFIFLFLLTQSCMPDLMIDYEGHRVFNPTYLFYLESESRNEWQKPYKIIKALGLSEGDVIADIGAGGGYFTEKFSHKVGKTGHVYSTDVQNVMIENLNKRVKKKKLSNVTVIQSGFNNPRLPKNSCDIVFFSSVYKEIEDRIGFLKKVKKSLKKKGRIAIIGYRKWSTTSGPYREDRLKTDQIIKELKTVGCQLSESFDFIPDQYFLLFKKSKNLKLQSQ
ncbi:MAG: methyltransferase type 11 [bacterium]|nr:MAG: methyltransferase type 11 [bacterium]